MSGDLAKEMRDAAERKIVGLYCVVERQLSDLRHEAPVAAYYALKESFVGETIETPVLAIAGGRGEDESEIGRVPLFKEAPLESDNQFVGRTDANKARHANCVAIANYRNGFIGGDDLVLEGHPAIASRKAIWRSPSRVTPATCRRRIRRHGRQAAGAPCNPSCQPLRPMPAKWQVE